MSKTFDSRQLLSIALVTVMSPALTWATSPASQTKKPNVITSDTRQAAEASNAFAFDLYAQLCRQEGNLFYSPASISTALAMAYVGSAGKTERQMAEVLHLNQVRVPEGFGALAGLLSNGDRGYRLRMANRLWGQKGYPFRAEFMAATSRHFRADLVPLDFRRANTARQAINRWIDEQTEGRIQQLIPSGGIDAQMRLVLTNAIYFMSAAACCCLLADLMSHRPPNERSMKNRPTPAAVGRGTRA